MTDDIRNGADPTPPIEQPDTDQMPAEGPGEQTTQSPVPVLPGTEAQDTYEGLDASDAEAYAKLKARRAERRRKKLIRRGIIAGAIAAVALVGVVAVNLLTQEPEAVFEPITDIAIAGTYTDSVDARGSLEPLSSTVVTPDVSGTIAEVRVAAGQQVQAGDVLMIIDNPELDLAVNEALRSLQAAEADLAAAKRARTDAYNEWYAYDEVTDEEGNVIPYAGADPAAAEDSVAAAERAVASAQASYDQAVATAGQRTVTAPSSGSIVAMNAQVGADPSEPAANSTGASGPLVQIADLSQMKVTIQVSEEDIARVAVGQTAQVSFPAFDDIMLQGTVQNIASIASGSGDMMYMGDSSVSFAVDILIDQPDPRLKPGMTAQVTLITEQLDNVVMVPSMALSTDDGMNYYVMVETDPETHEAERRDVTVVTQNDSYAVVGRVEGAGLQTPENEPEIPLSPVADGEIIVISGGSMSMGDGAVGSGAASADAL